MKQKLLLPIAIFLLPLFTFSQCWQSIAGGGDHTVGIGQAGTLWAWGNNTYGQLGDGTTVTKNTPTQIGTAGDWQSVATGYAYTIAIKTDGTLWAWGNNDWGQLGDGTTIDKYIPTQIGTSNNWQSIVAGEGHNLAIKQDGTLWAWGNNVWGQLGDGTTVQRNSPVQIGTASNWKTIAAGFNHTIAIKQDGTLWAWGYNEFGQLGDGTGGGIGVHLNNPTQIGTATNWKNIAGGESHTVAVKQDGTLWAWGTNGYGQLGDGTTNEKTVPTRIGVAINWENIAAGREYTIATKQNGTLWVWGNNVFGLGDGTTVEKDSPAQIGTASNWQRISARYYHTMAINQAGTAVAWGHNYYGQLGDGTTINRSAPVQPIGAPCHVEHYVHGSLYADANNDCSKQTLETNFPFPVMANPGGWHGFQDTSGQYSLAVHDYINYTITSVIPNRFSHMVTNPCPVNYSLTLTAANAIDTNGFDFGFDYSPCHQLRVDVSSDRRRRCFNNYTTVYYTNEGLIAANGVAVHVKMPQYVIPVAASLPYTWDVADSSMVFNIGTLNANQYGYITITDSVACINGITGLTQCTKAWILPPNTCLIDSTTGAGWDHSSIVVTGACVNDTVRFVILNHGSGDMTVASQYRIYADNLLVQAVPFQLNSADSLVVKVVSLGAAIRLEADQHPDHPGNSHPRETIEACGTGTPTLRMVNQAPMDDEDVDIEIDCMEIRDSYDPNEKTVSPEGVDASHKVLPNTMLDYVIHFQNTGSDTAYKIIVIDTLSTYLDIATLEPGVGSHPYTMGISGSGKPVLTFTFNNINLVDSATREPLSHGYVKFKIAPFSNVALGTQINNTADIYFDFNLPIRTNTAFVTLDNFSVATSLNDISADTETVFLYPNPAHDKLTVSYTGTSTAGNIIITDVLGKIYSQSKIEGNQTVVDVSALPAGVYFVNVKGSFGVLTKKVVVMK